MIEHCLHLAVSGTIPHTALCFPGLHTYWPVPVSWQGATALHVTVSLSLFRYLLGEAHDHLQEQPLSCLLTPVTLTLPYFPFLTFLSLPKDIVHSDGNHECFIRF